ncbi:hypothetical protein [Tepidibacter aestuarii]|uniref:hypothetical protein n=1 Tax=Tepidibacter aestuarii TaxID=2925782 RepID=UPI0020C10ED1|nr:hypothetical protein [Tepidibacter aestuarii]CAH2213488.1 conserved protein of unknown function [Tepidibacter aestuarii]
MSDFESKNMIVNEGMLMKKIYIITLFVLIVLVGGCNKNSNLNESSIGDQKTTESLITEEKISDESNIILEDINLDQKTWKTLNIFFSNFSEADVPFFEKDGLKEDEMIAFGIRHNILNNPKRIVNDEKISSKYVEDSCEKYFGKRISQNKTVKAYEVDSDVGYYEYNSGYYFIGENEQYQIDPYRHPTGETDKFSQVTKFQYNKEQNVYKASINIYSFYPDSDFNGEIYDEKPKEWELRNEPEYIPTVCDKAIETIERLDDGRYILIDYMHTK